MTPLHSHPTETDRRRQAALEQDLRLLVPIARRQARKAGVHGITVENVKRAAESAGILLGSTDRGYLSTLFGSVMLKAGLKPIKGRYARTHRHGTKGGNLVGLWRAA